VLRKYKPGVSLRTHYTVAAFIWSAVGLMLLIRGGGYLLDVGALWLLVPAIAIGTCKSLLILDKSARKNLNRLSQKEDGSCLGGVYSPVMWGLILAMMIMGILLRRSGLPREYLGIFYGAIGWALLFSSRLLWGHFRRS